MYIPIWMLIISTISGVIGTILGLYTFYRLIISIKKCKALESQINELKK